MLKKQIDRPLRYVFLNFLNIIFNTNVFYYYFYHFSESLINILLLFLQHTRKVREHDNKTKT